MIVTGKLDDCVMSSLMVPIYLLSTGRLRGRVSSPRTGHFQTLYGSGEQGLLDRRDVPSIFPRPPWSWVKSPSGFPASSLRNGGDVDPTRTVFDTALQKCWS